ncbi:MAG: caspase family protein, partial [Planctomycetaceae bacterium]|nr:caspase family protein [Planctomycetaceae bacterium]
MRTLSLLLILSLYTSGAPAARPARPQLVPEFRGPSGRTLVLGFFRDGNRVFSAGENKAIQTYHLPDQRVIPGNVLRWELSRAGRGNINAAALSSDGTILFVGGYSARGDRDVVGLNATTGNVVRVLPASPNSDAHLQSTILSLATSSDGRWLASAGSNGEIRIWDLHQPADQEKPIRVRSPGHKTIFNRVAFLGSKLLYSYPTDTAGTRYRIAVCNPVDQSTAYFQDITTEFQNDVTAIGSVNDAGVVFVCDVEGNGVLRHGGTTRLINLRPEGTPKNCALSPDGRLLAVVGDRLDSDRSFLTLYDTHTAQLRDSADIGRPKDCQTVVFSGDSRQLLTHDDSRESVILLDVSAQAGNRPLSAPNRPTTEIRGRGKRWLTARFLAEKSSVATGYSLHLNEDENRSYEFNLSAGRVVRSGQNQSEITPDHFSGGWSIRFGLVDPVSYRQAFSLISPEGRSYRVTVDTNKQGQLTGSYCFLPDANGRPFAVAVGTANVYEIFVYRLTDLREENTGTDALCRFYRDHSGSIQDLSVSSDGRYLASASLDKSVKIWSLAGLARERKTSVFGASLTIENSELKFRDVDPAGICFARGIRNGFTLDRAGYFSDSLKKLIQSRDPAEMQQLLLTTSELETVYLWVREIGTEFDPSPAPDDDRIIVKRGWEPLLTLVTDRNDDWVLFTPEGFYNASIAEGNRLFGWHINQGRDQSPIFEPAAHLQKTYEKPDVIRRVLELGSVDAAFNVPRSDLRAELHRNVVTHPRITIIHPPDGRSFEYGTTVDVTADIEFPQGTNAASFEASASVNSRFLEGVSESLNGRVRRVSWKTTIRESISEVRVGISERNPGHLNNLYSTRSVFLHGHGTPPHRQPQLFFFGIGVNTYHYLRHLRFCVEDVTSVRTELAGHRLLTREMADPVLLTEQEVTKERVSDELNKLVTRVRSRNVPEDLVIVYVSGHGVLGQSAVNPNLKQFYFVPPAVNDAVPDDLRRNGISWPDLCDIINRAPCNVAWFVDACHAGAAENSESSLSISKAGARDATGIHGRWLIWAADEDEEALETVDAVVRKDELGHGYFTMAVLETLIGNEYNSDANRSAESLLSDGSLDLMEMAA